MRFTEERAVASLTTDAFPARQTRAVRLFGVAASLAAAVKIIEARTSRNVANVTAEARFVVAVAASVDNHSVLAALRVAATTSPA